MKISKRDAKLIGDKLKINFDVVVFDEWHSGLDIELEHFDLTKGDLRKTARIAIAHLKEDPSYYKYLIQQEAKREKYWSTRIKPSIFL